MKIWAFLLASGCLLTAGDLIMKQWIESNLIRYCFIAMFVYFAGMIFLALSYRYKYMSIAICITCLLNIIIVSIIGSIFYKEHLNVKEIIGISLSIVSIVVLQWKV
jgi:multidrug transporter EmrE-like cation transporter